MEGRPTISAQVSLHPEYAHAMADVIGEFERDGFETAMPFAGNFSIVGDRGLFERVFRTKLEGASVLPLDGLRPSVREKVAAVLFTSIDFGPTAY